MGAVEQLVKEMVLLAAVECAGAVLHNREQVSLLFRKVQHRFQVVGTLVAVLKRGVQQPPIPGLWGLYVHVQVSFCIPIRFLWPFSRLDCWAPNRHSRHARCGTDLLCTTDSWVSRHGVGLDVAATGTADLLCFG